MIPYNQRNWFHMLASTSGSLSQGVMPRLVAFGAIASIQWIAHRLNPRIALSVSVYEVAGAVIALILAFRTNRAYERFWEGRILWGSIVNASRNLVRIVSAHSPQEPEATRDFASWVVSFAHASRRSLRGERERPEIERLLSTDQFAALDSNHHPALYAAQRISASLAAFARGGLEANMASRAEDQVNVLVNSLGGCERIAKTPTPIG